MVERFLETSFLPGHTFYDVIPGSPLSAERTGRSRLPATSRWTVGDTRCGPLAAKLPPQLNGFQRFRDGSLPAWPTVQVSVRLQRWYDHQGCWVGPVRSWFN
ncbi:hypothetical protein GCM10023170_088730 [Phytohabitans houttuyneae]|uniref:Uncharacterized protein n=1 Tax=Phytohabitans houttuyneae TaxID=1076126 RepID=A0A6V8K628_9ACTN|nr:hypothetical protein Phou_016260 [Phytohabitans houttuyneae]